MAKYHVGCGFADIYAGILNNKGDMWRQKSDVTHECLAASAQYLVMNDAYYGFELKGQKYRLTVIKEDDERQTGKTEDNSGEAAEDPHERVGDDSAPDRE